MNEPRLLLPPLDLEPWPTLGGELCDWIEEFLVHGPGDVRGQPVRLTEEVRLFIYRAYEVYPHGHRLAGRRRFKRGVLSRRKGTAKTEIAAFLAIAEMDPTAPVRCDGFRKHAGEWLPVGRSVADPYIPMVATTEEQSDDLAYGAAKAILENCDLGNSYYVGEERIMHRDVPGEMKALASAPSARDGARTTFQHFDETHLFVSERLKASHATMLRNIPKRREADAWSLETSTMYAPGEESVAESSHLYAEEIKAGKIDDPRLLFDHRQAAETHDLETKRGLLAAIVEASGDAIAFADVDAIAAQYREAAANRDEGAKNRFRRYWLNQRRSLVTRAFPPDLWASRARDGVDVGGERIVLAFDGSYSRDSTALVGCTVAEKPHIFVVEAWERPPGNPTWRTPRNDVIDQIDDTMGDFDVAELAPDPPGWHREVEDLEAAYGEVVVRFETSQTTRMGPACDEFMQALRDGAFSHDGDERLARHISHCIARKRGRWVIVDKEHPDSPLKIDLAVGAIIAYHRARWHHLNGPAGDFVFELIDPYAKRTVPA
jgi:phage terminase large subunit-like protein